MSLSLFVNITITFWHNLICHNQFIIVLFLLNMYSFLTKYLLIKIFIIFVSMTGNVTTFTSTEIVTLSFNFYKSHFKSGFVRMLPPSPFSYVESYISMPNCHHPSIQMHYVLKVNPSLLYGSLSKIKQSSAVNIMYEITGSNT